MKSDFERSIIRQFSGVLKKHNFRLVASECEPEAFDNSQMTFESEDFLLRIYRDRSYIGVDVGPRGAGDDLVPLR